MRPSVYEFQDYRIYLRAMFDYLQENTRNFSFRSLSKRAGVSAPGYFKAIADGKRNLSEETIPKFAKALGMKPKEGDFFRSLVLFNQATDLDERSKYFEKLVKDRSFQKHHPIHRDQYDYYSNWYYPVIREMVISKNFRNDPKWIAQKLGNDIQEIDVVRALNTLDRLGFVEDREGQLIQSSSTVTTGPNIASVNVVKFHREMMRKASEALAEYDSDEREIRSITFSCQSDQFERIRAKIDEFRKEILSEFGEGVPADNQIFQLNIQLFPLTKNLD